MPGLSEDFIIELSASKNEPEWMLDFRLKAYRVFKSMPMPGFGPDFSGLNFSDILYYLKPRAKKAKNWDGVPKEIRKTFEKLGVPEHEKRFFAGLEAQFESESIYGKLKKEFEEKGVIFSTMDEAVQNNPELLKRYLGTLIPHNDNKFSALTNAVWSGGSFVYIPKGLKLDLPLHAYFRIETEKLGQFERTLIIADEDSSVEYVEGCTAPLYGSASLHTGVVELIALKNAYIRYTTLQNWPKNVYNLVTQRAVAHENAFVEWIDGNIGSKITMKYPTILLKGARSKGKILSVSLADKGQELDSGGKVLHLAHHTTSTIISKSISKNKGKSIFRGDVKIEKQALHSSSFMKCDNLLLGANAEATSIPKTEVKNALSEASHEASTGRVSVSKLFYLMSRGFSRDEAQELVLLGFVDAFIKELPFEYAIEFNKLMRLVSE